MNSLIYVVLLASVSFFYYGLSCLISPHLVKEFRRYGLPEYRILTGVLQLFGAGGLLVGMFYPWLGVLAATGLALLMMAGFITRIRIKDSFLQMLPSFFFMILNAYIASAYYLNLVTKGE